MSKVPKVAISAIALVLVLAGAVVVYRETDLLTGSLVVLAGLMIAALLARRAAAREERDGMAEWEAESRASVEAADELFADWRSTTPINDEWSNPPAAPAPAPAPAPPAAAPTSNGNGSHPTNGTNGTNGSNGNGHAPVAEPAAEAWDTAAPTEQGSDSWWDSSDSWDAPAPAAPPAPPAPPVDEAPAPEVEQPEPEPEPVDLTSSTTGFQDDGYTTGELADFVGTPAVDEPDSSDDRDHGHGGPDADTYEPVRAPEPAYASVAASQEGRHSPIDWTGQGGRVNERVSSSDDILAASEATALPAEGSVAGGSELARLLAKVEARLRDYE